MEINKLRVAIVHDSMMEYGGAEELVSYVIKLFPNADIYTSSFLQSVKDRITKRRVRTSFIHHIPLIKNKTSLVQFFSPLIWRLFNFSNYDLVITSSSFGLANTIKTKGIKIDYIHSLPKNLLNLSKKWTLQKIIPYTFLIKHFYLKNLKKSQHIIVNSKNIQRIVSQHSKKKSTIIYPPIKNLSKARRVKPKIKPSFITISRLSPEKNIELAIKAFNQISTPLLVIGNGKDLKYTAYLKRIAKQHIKFLGFISDRKRNHLYSTASGLVHCHPNEDFGMVIAEAMSYGCPAIAYNHGGPKEIILPSVTGELFNRLTVTSLLRALDRFKRTKFNHQKITDSVSRFASDKFNSNLLKYINNVFDT